MATIQTWLQQNLGRLILLAVVVLIAVVASKVVSRILHEVLDRANMPSASIFINITRVLIWAAAITIVLQPVFGVNPTTLVTALGVGGVAVSLGMQDTIANIISGFGLMFGKVIQPGDLVRIQGTTGEVKDITWRQTVIVERGGNEMVIPNSVLNTSSLERLTPAAEGCVTVPFTIAAGQNPEQVERAVLDAVDTATEGMRLPDIPTQVKFTGFTPYGVTAEVQIYTRFDVFPSTAADAAARALAGAPFLEQHAAAR